MTLSKAMSEYLRWRAVYKRSSRESIDTYDRVYRMFLAHVSAAGLLDVPSSLNVDTVREWGLREGERGVSSRTIASRFGLLASLADYMLRLKDGRGRPLLTENPVRMLERPKYRRPESKFLHPDELRAFLAVEADPHVSLARDVLLDTMLRVSEIANANVGDMVGPDADGNYELVARVKGGAERRVPLSPDIVAALQEKLLARGAVERTAPLLVNTAGQRWTRHALSQRMVALGRKAGVKRFNVSAHKLRHTGATVALHSGADLKQVQSLLGHSQIETTATYLHLVPGSLHEARVKQREGLGRYING